MQIIIKGKQMDVTPQLRQRIEHKVQRLSRLVPEEARVEVTVTEEQTRSSQNRFSVQLALTHNFHPIHSEVRALNATTALDLVIDKVVAQLGHYKGKRTTVKRHHTPGVKVLALSRAGDLTPLEEAEEEHSVDSSVNEQYNEEIWSRIKEIHTLPTQPMNSQEVIEQMEQSGATFLPFFNEETRSVNVMYKLDDGGYGLLVPSLE